MFRPQTAWKNWRVTGRGNTAFVSMISTESASPWKETTSLTWKSSIITDAGKEEIHMSSRIPTPTMGEILMEEFMGPMNLSAYRLAQSIHVPTSRIQDILHNRRKISADTSIRLGRFFGVSDRFFLDMQIDIEVRELIEKLDGDITTIKPYTAVAM